MGFLVFMAIADGKFFTFDDLQNELGGRDVLVRVFDDERMGDVTEPAVKSFMDKADARVSVSVVKGYPTLVAASVTPATAHPYLKTLAVELCAAMIRVRWPSLFKHHNAGEALDRAERHLRDLAIAKTTLDGVDQALNTEAAALSIGSGSDCPSVVYEDFGVF